MSASIVVLWSLAALAGLMVWRRDPAAFRNSLVGGTNNIVLILPRIILALITAGFVSKLVPSETVGNWIGPETGLTGIFIACLIGGAIPSGPIIAFPLVLVLLQAGAGIPQIISFLTAWAVFALHRILMYEATMMGWHFAITRMLSSLILPIVAGLLAMAFIAIFGEPNVTAR